MLGMCNLLSQHAPLHPNGRTVKPISPARVAVNQFVRKDVYKRQIQEAAMAKRTSKIFLCGYACIACAIAALAFALPKMCIRDRSFGYRNPRRLWQKKRGFFYWPIG